ncbi:MAG: pyridoxal phosphate-dependent decarboxylase family protein, partial [Gemmatimonadaceae bacterium]
MPKPKVARRKEVSSGARKETKSPTRRDAPADMPPEQFRELGHALVDSIADFYSHIPTAPTASPLLPDAMRKVVGTRKLPEKGADIGPVLEDFSKTFFRHSTHNGSPRFWGYITSSGAPIGALADLLAAAVNPNCGAWALSPVATEIENECIRWLSEFMGLPGTWDGIVVSGGNMANIVAFIAARKAKAGWDIRAKGLTAAESKRFVLYGSAETHTWISKAADICGMGTDAVRWIETEDHHRMRTDALRKQIVADRAAGLFPFMVC